MKNILLAPDSAEGHIARSFHAADPVGEITQTEMSELRAGLTDISKSLNSLDDLLDEPLKGQFKQAKDTINRALAALPETDKVPAALDAGSALRQLLWAFRSAQDTIGRIAGIAKDAKSEVATVRASMGGEIDKAIDGKIKAGELFKKEDHTAAVQEAEKNSRALFSAELKTLSERRTKAAELGIPAPADEVLTGEEKVFTDLLSRAKNRLPKLKGFTLASAQTVELAWVEPDAGFDKVISLMTAQKPKSAGHPFAGGTPKPGDEKKEVTTNHPGVI
jgi:hypothetical protein